jgi:hypothetical protein
VSPDNKHVYVTAIADDAVSWFTQTTSTPTTCTETPDSIFTCDSHSSASTANYKTWVRSKKAGDVLPTKYFLDNQDDGNGTLGPKKCMDYCYFDFGCRAALFNSASAKYGAECYLFNVDCETTSFWGTERRVFRCVSNGPTFSPTPATPTSPTPASTADEGSSDSVGTIIGVSVGVLAFAGVAYITFKKKKNPGEYGSDVETAT